MESNRIRINLGNRCYTIVSCSVMGEGKIENQDSVKVCYDENQIVIVAADGLGSAIYSKEGSQKITLLSSTILAERSDLSEVASELQTKWKDGLEGNLNLYDTTIKFIIDEETREILSKHLPTQKFSPISNVYTLVSINLARCSEDNTFADKVYRRFYSIGDNFSSNEKSELLTKWCDYKSGIVILTPINLKNNFLKLERIINYHILKSKIGSNKLELCPICEKPIKENSPNNYSCHYCHHSISFTYCNDCDAEHRKPILWVKYTDDNFLQNETIVRGVSEKSPYYRMGKIETIMGEHATTSFELEYDVDRWKLKTICPHCGIKLGDNK